MQSCSVCPFFRKSDDFCDVGCGYISPHDVRMMVAYCNCRYDDCLKYRELANRFPEVATAPLPVAAMVAEEPVAAVPAQVSPAAPLKQPLRARWPLAQRVRSLAFSLVPQPKTPTQEETTMSNEQTIKNRGWTVTMAGLGINLALGILYAYSMLKADIAKLLGANAGDPYAFACLSFAVSMILGGKMQDKFGPRLTAILGGLFVGAGFIVCAQSTGYWGWVFGFGILAGLGFGFGYSAATPPAVKWFPTAKTGLIVGIVVAGFGIAPVYLAPVCKYLLGAYGLSQTMTILGVSFIAIVCGMAMLVANPPAGFVPAAAASVAGAPKKAAVEDKTPSQVLRDSRLYTLWTTFFIGAGAGLMVIGSIALMAKKSMGEYAFIAVAVMAIGNAGGRVIAGIVSDKIGRGTTLTIMLLFQAILMFVAIPVISGGNANGIIITLLATFIGFNYGTNLCLFPSFAKDFWGAKNYGMNYGILFTAWGIGAFALVKISAFLDAKFGSSTVSFAAAGVLLLIGSMLSLSLRGQKAAATAKVPVLDTVEEGDLALQKAD
ncbi:MAG TPA: MFS transporter [Desulfuromonas sp.]|nr:MFS transporter [Desulfuromonas sp.]